MSLSLSMTRVKVGVFSIDVYQYDGTTPQSLVGSTLWFHASVGGVAIDKSSPSGGISITNSAGGAACAQLTIDAADTTDVSADGASGPCELTLVNASSVPYELAQGTITVLGNVGTP